MKTEKKFGKTIDTVIFDMDGVLIDSEPLWHIAAVEIFKQYGINLTAEQYATTTGLRTKEFVEYWFEYFSIPTAETPKAIDDLLVLVIDLVKEKGKIMPGIPAIFDFFAQKGFKIGLATSSPHSLIEVVVAKAGINHYLQVKASAEDLPYGKPHPDVYLQCAALLGSHPTQCICFEDSFNGMLAAKSARMKCVVIPAPNQLKDVKWGAADLKLSSLQNFGNLHLENLIAQP